MVTEEQAQEPITDFQNPPEPEDPTAPIGRKPRQRGGVGEDANQAFNDIIVNVEDDDGIALLKLLESRKKTGKAASQFNRDSADIKKQMASRGYLGKDGNTVRVGIHLITIAAESDDKIIEEHTRAGSNRVSIKHGE